MAGSAERYLVGASRVWAVSSERCFGVFKKTLESHWRDLCDVSVRIWALSDNMKLMGFEPTSRAL